MSAPCTEPPEPAAVRYEIGGTVVETVRRTDGWWLYRCPEILPINARYWRGHFESEQAAIADFIDTAITAWSTAKKWSGISIR